MKACGIVAEYNPLHTGHVYQMNKARQISQADCIIVVMSGNFVQRGEPAVIDKYARTKAALKAGADIIVELPVFYALSSAENFARGAVLTLSAMKVSSMCFGAETENKDMLAKISRTIISESHAYKSILNKTLACGLSYPAARQTALLEYLPECKDIITGSNNILAIEYIKAILGNELDMAYYPVLREGAGYNDDTDNAEYASAFGIRKMIMSGESDKLKTYLTPDMSEGINLSQNCPLFIDDFSSIFNHKMLFIKQLCNINHVDFAEELAKYEDINSELANRFAAAFTGRDTITEFAMNIKSKNIVYSRISRCIMHIILEIRKTMSDIYNNIPYIRLLGFNKTGQQYLGNIKKELDVPFITKTADYKNELSFDLSCSDIYSQAVYEKYGYVMKNELQQNIIRI